MAIDKSLSQYQEDLLEGTTLGALRKAGVVSPQIPVQTPKVDTRWETPKVGGMKPAEEISFQPAAEIKTASPFKLPTAKGLASFDQKKYNDLARAFYDKTKAEGTYIDKHVQAFLNRPYGPRTVDKAPTLTQEEIWDRDDIDPADRGTYLTSSLTSEKSTPTLDKIFAPLTQTLTEGATAFNDTQMENIYKDSNSDDQKFITKLIDDGTKVINNNPYVVDALKTGGRNYAQNKVGGFLAKELGFTGAAAGGPVGMALGWLAGKVFDFFRGNPDKKEVPGKYGFNYIIDGKEDKKEDDTVEDKIKEQIKKQEEIWDRDDVDPAERGFVPVGTYGDNVVYSSEGISVDSETGDITNADGTHGGNILDEFPTGPSKSAPASVSVPSHIGPSNGGSDNGGGWSGSGGRSDDSWSSSPFLKGGRVDKALTGGSKDI